jgi:hypothetical protein
MGFFTPDMFPEPKVEAPSSTTRQLVVDLVVGYAASHHKDIPIKVFIKQVYHSLFRRMCNSSLRFNVYVRHASLGGKGSYIDTIETFGYIDELLMGPICSNVE